MQEKFSTNDILNLYWVSLKFSRVRHKQIMNEKWLWVKTMGGGVDLHQQRIYFRNAINKAQEPRILRYI